jgi:signal transduction histidine kinase
VNGVYFKLLAFLFDAGPGIPVDQQGHLFDAFITSKNQGMGLGLAICKMIVERHGGQISAASSEHAMGATFRFVLPRDLPTNLPPYPHSVVP